MSTESIRRSAAQTLDDFFGNYPVAKLQRRLRQQQVLAAFPDYVDNKTFTIWLLSLYRFATMRPLIYLRPQTVQEVRAFFNQYPDLTLQALAQLDGELSHAIFSLLRPGSSWGKEGRLSVESPDRIAEFESTWHPEYQRYCEHVYNHLIRIPLFVLGTLKDRKYLAPSLTLTNRVDILRRNGLVVLTQGHDPIVRNAISHGATRFELLEIEYADSNAQTRLGAAEFAALFDNLVDTCHSLLVGLLLFLCDQQNLVEMSGLHNLPLGVRFLFLDAFASHDNLQLLSAADRRGAGNRRQLGIVCRISSRSRQVQQYEALQVCWTASSFGGKDYARFEVSFDCGAPVMATMFVNGERLHRAITAKETLGDCGGELIETSLLWYDASRVARALHHLRSTWSPTWKFIKEQIVADWRARGLQVLASRYTVRDIEDVSTERHRRIEAHVVLRGLQGVPTQLLNDIVRHAIARLRGRWMRQRNAQGGKGLPGRPHYVWIRLYAHDARVRTLRSYTSANEDLILLAEWFSPWNNIGPGFVRKPHIVVGRIRIYNPNLIEAPGRGA